jgi:phenylalanyl-tRNA synthetase beta chain
LEIDSSLPNQPLFFATLLAGEKESQNPIKTLENWQWFDSIALASSILDQLSIEFDIRAGEAPGFHPGRTAEIWASNELVGIAGELHPKIQEEIGSASRIALAQLNFDVIAQVVPMTVSAKRMSNYPVAKEDLAVVVPEELPIAKILTSIASLQLKELESVEVFDIYQGSQIQAGSKSVALALKFRAVDHTLSADEISSLKGKILDTLKSNHQAELRE